MVMAFTSQYNHQYEVFYFQNPLGIFFPLFSDAYAFQTIISLKSDQKMLLSFYEVPVAQKLVQQVGVAFG